MDINDLISDNIGLVYKQLTKFNLVGNDDAYSYGLEALGRAAKTYNKNKNIAFSTYASACIYNGIAMYLRDTTRYNKLPTVSYDVVICEDNGGDCFQDLLIGPNTTEQAILDRELYDYIWYAFDKKFEELPSDTARNIIQTWRDSNFEISQQELARVCNTSQPYVSRIISAFRHKFKKEMEKYK